MQADRVHDHTVAEHQPVKTKPAAQDIVHDAAAHRRRDARRLDLREQNMAAHYRRNSGLNRGAERHKLCFFQLRETLVDAGQAEMGVDRRVPVAGEMLAAAQKPRRAVAAHGLRAKLRDPRRVVAEASHADDRVHAVAVDVEVGREVEVDADAAQLARGDARAVVCVADAPRRGDGHAAGDVHGVGGQARDHAALLIDGDESGVSRLAAHKLLYLGAESAQLRRIFHIVSEKYHVAELELAYKLCEFLRQLRTLEAENQPLADHFANIHDIFPPFSKVCTSRSSTQTPRSRARRGRAARPHPSRVFQTLGAQPAG